MEPHKPDLKTIFCEALELPAGPDRLAYLERACGDDPALCAGVDELLRARPSRRLPRLDPRHRDPRSRRRTGPGSDRRRQRNRRGRFAAPRDVPRRRHRPARRGPHPRPPGRSPRDPALASAPTSSSRRSARAAWAPSSSPSRTSRSGDALRSRSSRPAWIAPRSSPASRPSARPWP